MRAIALAIIISSAFLATAPAGEIFPSQDTVDARKLQPGALVMLEPSAPMALNVNDLGIYSGAIDEGNRTKQKLLIETGRIFYWDTQHYRLCKVISIGAYGICQLQDVVAKKVAYSSAAFLHRAILSQ